MVIPFGSCSALQRYVVDGSIVKTVSQGRFIVTDNDDRSYMSWQITALKQSAPQRPTVYLLGGSPMRACILSTATLAKALNPRQATLVGAKMPASSVRDYPRALAIIDNPPKATGGVIVIGAHRAQSAEPRSSATDELQGIDLLEVRRPGGSRRTRTAWCRRWELNPHAP